ncbi:MAG: hypothetical protein QXT38_02280 [Candidatus Aenigmatarchaeota archaeon]
MEKIFKVLIPLIIILFSLFYFFYEFFPKLVKPQIHFISLEKVYSNPIYSNQVNNSKVKLRGIVITPFSLPVIGGWIEYNGFIIPVENLSNLYKPGDFVEVTGIFYSFGPLIVATEDVYLNHTGLESIKYQIKNLSEIQNVIEIGKVIKIPNVYFKNKTISENYGFFELTFDDNIKCYCLGECEKIEIGKNYFLLVTFLNPNYCRILFVEEVR